MDLIYANHQRYALGQLSSFDLDFDATGSKDFELTIDEALLEKGYWIFIPNTEIGGIVDSITVNTEERIVKYNGRNFRGILNDKILSVPRDDNYLSVQGDIDEVINTLLSEAGLSDYFECLTPDTEDVDYYIDYSFEPFCTLYDGLMGIADSINFKLLFSYNAQTNKVEITPSLAENFTDFLTYTQNSSVNLELQDNAMAVNHFILVGYSEGKRYQIDLFVNANSQIMDFTEVLEPIKDSQYILDNRNQQFFGIDERTKITIEDNISPIENYEPVRTKPNNWNKKYASYYTQKTEETADGVEVTYDNVEPRTMYRKLTSQPTDWEQNYASFFTKDGDEYKSVDGEADVDTKYKKVKKKPKGWSKNYGDYYYRTTDGLTYSYTSVNGLTKAYYKKQKYRPTDWTNNWKSYYQVNKKDKKTKYEAAGTYYRPSKSKKGALVKENSKNAPKWQKYKYYTKVTKSYAPKFSARDIYVKIETTGNEHAPAFEANKYYRAYDTAPYFKPCFRMVFDHYGGMISNLLENLEVYPTNQQNVSITDFEADIGDVVGGYDEKTNITLSAPITNIIYRIERGIQRSIEYTIGG